MESILFDRRQVRTNRDRVARYPLEGIDFLKTISVDIITQSLSAIHRSFDTVLDVGCHTGQLGKALMPLCQTVVGMDLSYRMLSNGVTVPYRVQADEEMLPFAPASFDAVFSALSLQSVNDWVGMLIQLYQVLKPDGLAMLSFLGGETLRELRTCLSQAEIKVTGGLSPRIFPMIDVKGAGQLMQRAGFKLPTAVSETVVVQYTSPFKLLEDLRGMGETNTLVQRQKTFMRREILLTAMEIYSQTYGNTQTGHVPATFEMITLTGWHHHDSQQQPLKPRKSIFQ
jgi:SAM-dependent methyltransferase